MDAAASGVSAPDENAAAYGEVVWSWRRDPGATSAKAGNGGKKGRFPGESAYKPSNHCAGKAGMSRLYLSNPCAFLTTHCTRRCGRSRRPAFPAPSCSSEGNKFRKLRRIRVVRTRAHVLSTSLQAKRSNPSILTRRGGLLRRFAPRN